VLLPPLLFSKSEEAAVLAPPLLLLDDVVVARSRLLEALLLDARVVFNWLSRPPMRELWYLESK
jgi:hypothetical protein